MEPRRPLDLPLVALSLALSLAILASPLLPAIDLPEHVALAVQLRRLWDGDPGASALYATNVWSDNGGLHVAVAALSYVMPAPMATRALLALHPPLLALGVSRVLAATGAPAWRARLVVTTVFGFSFAWGFANFVLGTAVAWNLLASLLLQLERPTWRRAAGLAALSALLGLVHVMATLLLCVTALAVGLEHLARHGVRRAPAVALAGAPLWVGPVWDLLVTRAHLAHAPASYTSPAAAPEFGPLRKLGMLGAHVSGAWGSYADTAIAWVVLGGVGALVAWRWRGVKLWAPLLVAALGYWLVPPVFLNTHLVFQRLACWIVLGLLVAWPDAPPRWEARLPAWSSALSALSVATALAHLVWFAAETRPALALARQAPPSARVTGVIERARTSSVRVAALAHAAALLVPEGALDEAFSFGRFLSMPVTYRPGATVAPPTPTWEHGVGAYQPESALARRFPFVVVRLRDAREPTESAVARIFREREVKVLAREEDWLLVDAR
ncbi:MAG: hypothetical protein IT374_00895 [Polyangiaceae bacterium]|nr:hypothetical protein [Polyangiaceae bacterium]